MLNLLAAFTPTEASPIDLVVLHLIKLVGRASSLVAHVPQKKLSRHPTQTERIFNSFNKFEDAYKGKITESSFALKQLNKNVLEKAPCSVGVLIDRGNQKMFWCGFRMGSIYQVVVLFFDGADDREALSYARRMRHADSKLMSEIRKWKHGELGVIGEILASLNIRAKRSILVVQQQIRFWGSRDPEESTHLRRLHLHEGAFA
ncbi:hypothetical protein JHK82_031559 [Glycine max]|nr:hypothetical protein JHK86_031647 [Glycine max]KAG5124822.1 hypothetical protein JHK82_031559 [Glycine max]